MFSIKTSFIYPCDIMNSKLSPKSGKVQRNVSWYTYVLYYYYLLAIFPQNVHIYFFSFFDLFLLLLSKNIFLLTSYMYEILNSSIFRKLRISITNVYQSGYEEIPFKHNAFFFYLSITSGWEKNTYSSIIIRILFTEVEKMKCLQNYSFPRRLFQNWKQYFHYIWTALILAHCSVIFEMQSFAMVWFWWVDRFSTQNNNE